MIYEIPVARREAVLSRRMLRSLQDATPRDKRPSRVRRERLSPQLRTWGARPLKEPPRM
jgi:hypothetical protein